MELDDTLVKNLLKPKSFSHKTENIKLIETHASWVILTGKLVYKIKKPVNFGFLDFSSLEKRKYFCEKELELNSILAKEMYLKVIPISGTKDNPILNDNTDPIEYSVVTSQFEQENLLNELEKNNKITFDMIKQIAVQLADFHIKDSNAVPDPRFASFETVTKEATDNFIVCKELTKDKATVELLDKLQCWSDKALLKLKEIIEQRQKNGFVKPCHGDVHLNNMVLIKDKVVLFDCIEFNDGFRYIDVINDLAFVVMDLMSRNHFKFAYYIINKYLERTGDYAGLELLKFYVIYRAMVKAKVALLTNDNETSYLFNQKINLVKNLILPTSNKIILTNGVSGVGKSYISKELSMILPAIRIRSDVERKRLHKKYPNLSLYSKEMDAITFEHLVKLTKYIYNAGYSVIVDATFIKETARTSFFELGKKLNAPVNIISIKASFDMIKSRIESRQQIGKDPSDADINVVEAQLKINEPLTEQEEIVSIEVDANNDNIDMDQIVDFLTS